MTSPGGGGNNINLAALWVPVMPETSKLGSEMNKAGRQAKQQFEQGFNTGTSPEQLGQSFGSKLVGAIGEQFRHTEWMGGARDAIRDYDEELKRHATLLKGQVAQAHKDYQADFQRLTTAVTRFNEVDQRVKSQGAQASQRDRQLQRAWALELEQAYHRASNSADRHKAAQTELNGLMGQSAERGRMLSGIMGGVVAGGMMIATQGVIGLVSALGQGIQTASHFAVETAKAAVHLGTTYDALGIQIHSFSTATGEDFERMNSAAQQVFSTLDVEGKNVGQTMAQLSSIMGVSGEDISSLTGRVTMLQGRFSSLKATDLGAIFRAFNVPAGEADSKLASLLQSARSSGQDLGQLTSALSGDAAITLAQTGMSLEQAGKFMAELMKLGPSGTGVISNLSTAVKAFTAEGLTFGEGMQLAKEKLEQLGDTVQGQDLAQKLFGTSRWSTAVTAVNEYVEAVNTAPEALSATASSVDEFLDSTQSLDNQIQEFKHQAADAFRPFGEAAKNVVLTGLNNLAVWFRNNRNDIINTIRGWGNELIDFLPKAQEWAVSSLRIFGDFAAGMSVLLTPLALNLATIGAAGAAMSGQFGFAKDLMEMAIKLPSAGTGVRETVNEIADKIEGIKIDTEAIKEGWNDAADSALTFNDVSVGMGAGITPFATPGAPGAPGGIGGGAGPMGFPTPIPGAPQAGSPGGTSGPGGIFGAMGTPGGSGAATPQSNEALARQMFPWPESEWAAFHRLEMKEAGFDHTADNPTSTAYGMGQFLDMTWEKYGYPATGTDDPATQLSLMFQYIKERYGTPSAALAFHNANNWYQTGGFVGKQSWFDQHGFGGMNDDGSPRLFPGGVPTNAPITAGVRGHMPDRMSNIEMWMRGVTGIFNRAGTVTPNIYEQQLFPRPAAPFGFSGGGGPRGTDTVPAWLTPGEYVWDTSTVDKHGWLIKALHQGDTYFQGGGGVGTGAWDPDLQGTNQAIHAIAAIAAQLGLEPTSGVRQEPGSHHNEGEAGDFSDGGRDTDAMLQFAMQMRQMFGSQLAELIYHDPRFSGMQIDEGQTVPDSVFAGAGDHHDHVHVAVRRDSQLNTSIGSQMPGGPSGVPGMSFGMPTGSPGGSTGMPGGPASALAVQGGGMGYYGGAKWDELLNAQQSVTDAYDRAADLDAQIADTNERIAELQQQIAEVGAPEIGPLGRPLVKTPEQIKADNDRREQLEEQLEDAITQRDRSTRERSQQDSKITEAERKQLETYYKRPGGDYKEYKVPGVSEFTQLGGGLLSGIGQSLGFGDLFSKPPWEWGAVKLLTSGINWAMGTANAWADEIGKGHTGMTGFQPIAGWEQSGSAGLTGLLSSMGVDVGGLAQPVIVDNFGRPVSSSVSTGPNVIQGQPSPGFGQPAGPAPGPPVIAGDYMPINVQAGVDPTRILQPVQEQRNAQNVQLHGQTGGLPQ